MMSGEFIPHQDYVVCPECKEKIAHPNNGRWWKVLIRKPVVISCPVCGAEIVEKRRGKLLQLLFGVE